MRLDRLTKKIAIKQIFKIVSYLHSLNVLQLHSVVEANHLRKLLSHYKVDCVFDVGANFGQYANMLREKSNYSGLIISFEPIPEAAAALRHLSKDDPLWCVEELALSDATGEQVFNIMSGHQFSSLSKPKHDEVNIFTKSNKISRSLKVKTESLDRAFKRLEESHNFKAPFLKMDTQGFDITIARHGEQIIHNFIGLQSELAIKKIYTDSIDYREAITIYEQLGFSLSAIVPNNQGHFPRLIEADCIMLRNDLLHT